MKTAVAVLVFTGVFGLAAEQESPSTQSRPRSIYRPGNRSAGSRICSAR
jgi:hypothetical protein